MTFFTAIMVVISQYTYADLDKINTIPNIKWDKTFSDNLINYKYQSMAENFSSKSLWVAITAGKQTTNNYDKLFLLEIDSKGNILEKILINSIIEEIYPANNREISVPAIAINKLGDITFIIEGIASGSHIVKLNTKRNVQFYRPLDKNHQGIVIRKIKVINSDELLLLGREYSDGLAVKIDKKGDVIWKKNIKGNGDVTMLFDGVVDNDEFVVIGNTGKPAAFAIAKSNIILIRMDKEGNENTRRYMQGQGGRIVKDGTKYMLVYDEDLTQKQAIIARSVAHDFKDIWSLKLKNNVYGLMDYQISSINSNQFIVVGPVKRQLWVARVTNSGKMLSEHSYESGFGSSYFDVATLDGLRAILSTYTELTRKRELYTKLHGIAFDLK